MTDTNKKNIAILNGVRITYVSAGSALGGLLTGLVVNDHYKTKNSEKLLSENAELYKDYKQLPNKDGQQARYMQHQLMANVKPPHTTPQQDIISTAVGIDVGVMLLAFGFRKSIKRFLTNGTDAVSTPDNRPPPSKNDLSL